VGNVPGIATVADLRASPLSTAAKAHAGQRPQNYNQAQLLWLYHVTERFSLSTILIIIF